MSSRCSLRRGFVDGLAVVRDDVETVEGDATLRFGHVHRRRVDVWLPHVHCDSLDPSAIFLREGAVVAVERLLLATVGHPEDAARVEVVDDGHVGVALAEGGLVDADTARGDVLATLEATLHDAVDLVPGQVHQVRDRRGARLLEPCDDEGIHQGCESRVLLRPRDRDLVDAVLGARDARYCDLEDGLVLAGRQVPPATLAMVVARGLAPALGAGVLGIRRVFDDHEDASTGDLGADFGDLPRRPRIDA